MPARADPRAASAPLQLLPSGRSLAVGFGLLATALALYGGARETAVFAVESIDIATEPAGHTRLVAHALAPLAGTSLLKIDEAAIARRLEPLPHVHLLGYDRSFPNGLRVYVSVERPVAVLRRAHENWLVSGERRVLRKLDRRLRRPLPVVWLPRTVEPRVGAVIRAEEPAREVSALADVQASDPTFARRIWYLASGEHGLTVVLRDHFEVRVGNASQLPLKLRVARRVLAALQSTDAAASYIDVAVPERPVADASLNSQIEP